MCQMLMCLRREVRNCNELYFKIIKPTKLPAPKSRKHTLTHLLLISQENHVIVHGFKLKGNERGLARTCCNQDERMNAGHTG